MPALLRMSGLTKMMYAMVRNVVIPATISVRTVVLFSLSLKSCSSIAVLPRSLSQCEGRDLCKASGNGSSLPLRGSFPTVRRHANEPVFPAHHEGESFGGADRLAPADAARRPGPADQRRYLRLAAARLPGAEEHRAHRARGAGRVGRAGSADADHPVGRAVARERPLRRLRRGDAAHQGPPGPRDALRPNQRGDDHRALPRWREELPRPA